MLSPKKIPTQGALVVSPSAQLSVEVPTLGGILCASYFCLVLLVWQLLSTCSAAGGSCSLLAAGFSFQNRYAYSYTCCSASFRSVTLREAAFPFCCRRQLFFLAAGGSFFFLAAGGSFSFFAAGGSFSFLLQEAAFLLCCRRQLSLSRCRRQLFFPFGAVGCCNVSCSFLCAVCVTGLAPCGVFSFCHARCCDVRSSQLKLN